MYFNTMERFIIFRLGHLGLYGLEQEVYRMAQEAQRIGMDKLVVQRLELYRKLRAVPGSREFNRAYRQIKAGEDGLFSEVNTFLDKVQCGEDYKEHETQLVYPMALASALVSGCMVNDREDRNAESGRQTAIA